MFDAFNIPDIDDNALDFYVRQRELLERSPDYNSQNPNQRGVQKLTANFFLAAPKEFSDQNVAPITPFIDNRKEIDNRNPFMHLTLQELYDMTPWQMWCLAYEWQQKNFLTEKEIEDCTSEINQQVKKVDESLEKILEVLAQLTFAEKCEITKEVLQAPLSWKTFKDFRYNFSNLFKDTKADRNRNLWKVANYLYRQQLKKISVISSSYAANSLNMCPKTFDRCVASLITSGFCSKILVESSFSDLPISYYTINVPTDHQSSIAIKGFIKRFKNSDALKNRRAVIFRNQLKAAKDKFIEMKKLWDDMCLKYAQTKNCANLSNNNSYIILTDKHNSKKRSVFNKFYKDFQKEEVQELFLFEKSGVIPDDFKITDKHVGYIAVTYGPKSNWLKGLAHQTFLMKDVIINIANSAVHELRDSEYECRSIGKTLINKIKRDIWQKANYEAKGQKWFLYLERI